MAHERDDEARLQNTIALEIANVSSAHAEHVILRALEGSWNDDMVGALAAAVRDPVIWAAIANARQAFELSQRPVISRVLREPGDRWSTPSEFYDKPPREPSRPRDKGDELERRARVGRTGQAVRR